ncbi:MAG: hypothetical protein JW981_02450 [Anaerolineae bacterium]|nr:hypothetical protein [Anaerolineae bacterium]
MGQDWGRARQLNSFLGGISWEVIVKKKRTVLLIVWLMLISCISACQRQGTLSMVSTSKAGVGYGVYVDEGYAYITNNDGVIVFDVHETDSPREVGRIQTSYYTPGIFVNSGWAYIASERGLVIADVSNPASPQQVGEYNSTGVAHRVCVDGSYAYIASSTGLEIVNIRNPNAPVKEAHLDGGEAWGVDIYEGIVYLAVPGNGLEVIDVSDPSSPQKIRTVSGTQSTWDVHIHQELAYVGCHDAGIRILSLSEKESPQIIGRYRDDDSGEALGVWGDGEHLYVADNFGVEVLDVKDPTNPFEIGEYGGVDGAHDIYVDGTFVYIAEGRKGLIILEFKENQGR